MQQMIAFDTLPLSMTPPGTELEASENRFVLETRLAYRQLFMSRDIVELSVYPVDCAQFALFDLSKLQLISLLRYNGQEGPETLHGQQAGAQSRINGPGGSGHEPQSAYWQRWRWLALVPAKVEELVPVGMGGQV